MLILGDWCINVNEYNARGVIIAISLHGDLHFIAGINGRNEESEECVLEQ